MYGRILIFILVILITSSHANTVSRTITSVPVESSGFTYSDGNGNYISVGETRQIPVVVQQYPNAVWVKMSNGRIPPNAVVVQYTNGYPNYYCRIQTGDGILYGRVIFNQGCMVDEYPQVLFSDYDVLSR